MFIDVYLWCCHVYNLLQYSALNSERERLNLCCRTISFTRSLALYSLPSALPERLSLLTGYVTTPHAVIGGGFSGNAAPIGVR